MRRSTAFCVAIALLASATVTFAQAAASESVRLFILSGQSNMQGLKPDASFTPAVTAAFPGDDVIVVKDAASGQPIRRWDREWKPPAGTGTVEAAAGPAYGDLYARLMTNVTQALGGRAPVSVAFVWMQGERDAKAGWSPVYAESLRRLIQRLRADLKSPAMAVVIGRLSDHMKGDPGWDAVRAAQEAVATGDPHGAWVDTDDCNGPSNDLHMTREGYVEMGRRFAAKAVELLGKP